MSKIYITGDTHGDFRHISFFHNRKKVLNNDDILIILGDAGLNYYVDKIKAWDVKDDGIRYRCDFRNLDMKKSLSDSLPATVFCVHGNHEARPQTIEGYKEKVWHSGKVLFQEEFPTLLFAKDGEIYNFNGNDYIVIGGAYSVDKQYRLKMTRLGREDYNWFDDEQPSEDTKRKVEDVLARRNWKIHGILSHTCPYRHIPRELFLPGIDQSRVDDSTERWLDLIEEKTEYSIWYFGHYHGEKNIENMRMLFRTIETLR